MKKFISRQESSLGRRRSNIPSLACAFSASATTGGTIYAFGVFANDLKNAFHISQMQLGAISAAFFIAGLFSWIPGIIVDRMKMRFSMACGGMCGATFTMLYWIICRFPDKTESVFPFIAIYPVATLSVIAVAISLSCGLIVGSVFKLTLLCGGPNGKGPAVGIAKGFVGLGSGIYATIFQAFRDPNESTLDFLPVIAFFFIICTTIPALCFLPTREHSHPRLMNIETTPLHFRTMYMALLILCLFILGSAMLDIWNASHQIILDAPEASSSTGGRQFGKVVIILIIWLGPIISLLFLPRQQDKTSSLPSPGCPPTETDPILPKFSPTTETIDEDEEVDNFELISDDEGSLLDSWRAIQEEEKHLPRHEKSPLPSRKHPRNIIVDFRYDLSLPEMLQTPSAWLMLWITLILVGSGTSKTNNMGQMVESLGFSEHVTPATLAIFSVAQAGSRIGTGILSEAALQWKVPAHFFFSPAELRGRRKTGIPRPIFLVIASMIALVAHLLLAAASQSLLWFVIGCTVSAIAFGMAWPLMVLIVGDVYGLEHHGANYMFYDGGTKALGTLLLSEYVAGSVYEAHVTVDDNINVDVDNTVCWGITCFQQAHLITAALAITCIFASMLLCRTTRHSYSSKI